MKIRVTNSMELFDLLGLFYDLDGVAFNPVGLTATFASRESARRFKENAPNWTVQYLRKDEGHD